MAFVGGTLISAMYLRKERFEKAEAGMTLVEVLVSSLMLVLSILPVMDVLAVARHAGLATQRKALVAGIGRSRINEVARLARYDLTLADGVSGMTTTVTVNTGVDIYEEYEVFTEVLPYPVPAASANLRLIQVTVTCPTCSARYGMAVPPTTLTSIIRKE